MRITAWLASCGLLPELISILPSLPTVVMWTISRLCALVGPSTSIEVMILIVVVALIIREDSAISPSILV